MGVSSVPSLSELEAVVARGSPVVLHFTNGASPDADELLDQLAADTPQAAFFRINPREQTDIAFKFGVAIAPSFVFIQNREVVESLQEMNPAQVAHKVAKLAGPPSLVTAAQPSSLGMSATPSVVQAVQRLAPHT